MNCKLHPLLLGPIFRGVPRLPETSNATSQEAPLACGARGEISRDVCMVVTNTLLLFFPLRMHHINTSTSGQGPRDGTDSPLDSSHFPSKNVGDGINCDCQDVEK
jgi:hypothetical protein